MAKIVSAFVVMLLFGTVITGWQSYNNVVLKEEQVVGAWAQVESTMQRKHDLLPNLVKTVRASARHEKDVLLAVTKQRTMSLDTLTQEIKDSTRKLDTLTSSQGVPSSVQLQDVSMLQQKLDQSVHKILVIAENYPALTSSENFLQLQSQLEGAENRINITRMQYNNAVRDYNVQIKKLPGNIMARLTGFQEKSYFEADKKVFTPFKVEL